MAVIKIPNGSGGWVKFPTIKGDKGPKGDKGEIGLQGDQGPKGDKGDTGEKGTDGTMTFEELTPEQRESLKGDQGLQGIPGEKGNKGDQGIQGIPGDKGPKGDQGDAGTDGYTPQKNIDYFDGAKGDKGEQGIPGTDATVTIANNLTETVAGKVLDATQGKILNDKIPDVSGLMPISGGVLENYREKLTTLSGTSTAINLTLGNVFTHNLTGNTTYTISNAVSAQAHSFTLIITQTATVRTLTFPASVKWQDGEISDLSTASKIYILTFVTVNGGATWLGMFGGMF